MYLMMTDKQTTPAPTQATKPKSLVKVVFHFLRGVMFILTQVTNRKTTPSTVTSNVVDFGSSTPPILLPPSASEEVEEPSSNSIQVDCYPMTQFRKLGQGDDKTTDVLACIESVRSYVQLSTESEAKLKRKISELSAELEVSKSDLEASKSDLEACKVARKTLEEKFQLVKTLFS